jgi:hypothetical protein
MIRWKFNVYRQSRYGRVKTSSDCIVETSLDDRTIAGKKAKNLIWLESSYRDQELELVSKEDL